MSWWMKNQRRYVLLLLVFAAVFETVYKVNDTHITHNLIINSDKLLVASCYLIIGGVIGLIVNLIFSNTPLGKVVDPAFGKIELPNKVTLLYAFVSGFLSALNYLQPQSNSYLLEVVKYSRERSEGLLLGQRLLMLPPQTQIMLELHSRQN